MLEDADLAEDARADGFTLPPALGRARGLGLALLGPWALLDGPDHRRAAAGLAARYPARRLVPFARRLDADDVACFERGGPQGPDGPRVLVIHDFASPGWELDATHAGFWDWLRAAVDDLIAAERAAAGSTAGVAGEERA